MAEGRVASRRRHSAHLRAMVLAQCAAPGASVAKVAMSHGLNANLVHGWRKQAREHDVAVFVPAACPAAVPARPAAGMSQFMPVSLTPSVSPPALALAPAPADIQIELRRGATAVKITWPTAAAADCAAWMRELLR